MADTPELNSGSARSAGSTPVRATIFICCFFIGNGLAYYVISPYLCSNKKHNKNDNRGKL